MAGKSGTRIQHIEVALHRLERLGHDDLAYRRAVAQASEADVARQAGVPDGREATRHLLEDGAQVERTALRAGKPNRVVQVKHVDVVATEPAQARLKRRADGFD